MTGAGCSGEDEGSTLRPGAVNVNLPSLGGAASMSVTQGVFLWELLGSSQALALGQAVGSPGNTPLGGQLSLLEGDSAPVTLSPAGLTFPSTDPLCYR